MIQIAAQVRILVAVEAIDGRKGIDAIAQLCREKLNADPFSGYLFIFRTRRGTAIRVLQYDGQGFWLATKRLSKGRFQWWPTGTEAVRTLRAHQAQLLLAAGNPYLFTVSKLYFCRILAHPVGLIAAPRETVVQAEKGLYSVAWAFSAQDVNPQIATRRHRMHNSTAPSVSHYRLSVSKTESLRTRVFIGVEPGRQIRNLAMPHELVRLLQRCLRLEYESRGKEPGRHIRTCF